MSQKNRIRTIRAVLPLVLALMSALMVPAYEAGAKGRARSVEVAAAKVVEKIARRAPPEGFAAIGLVVVADGKSVGRGAKLVDIVRAAVLNALAGSLLAGRLEVVKSPDGKMPGMHEFRSRHLPWVLRIGVSLAGSNLLLSVDLSPTPPGFWQWLAGSRSTGKPAAWLVSVEADEEVRFSAGFDLHAGSTWALEKVIELDFQALDVTCAQLNGSAELEVVVLGGKTLRVFRQDSDALVQTEAVGLESLPSPRMETRDDTGRILAADIEGDGKDELLFWSSVYLVGQVLRYNGVRFTELRRLKTPVHCAYSEAGRNRLVRSSAVEGTNIMNTAVTVTDMNSDKGTVERLSSQFYRMQCYGGGNRGIRLAYVSTAGDLVMAEKGKGETILHESGTAFWLGEGIDGNLLEVYSLAVRPGEPDRIVVRKGGKIVWQSEQWPYGFVAMSLCEGAKGGKTFWIIGRSTGRSALFRLREKK